MHTLVLLGELDRASTATLEAAIERLCDSEVTGITLDLSKLTYIDATGIAVIAFRCRWCQARGYEFALVPGSRFVQHEFEKVGALRRLPFVAPRAQDAAETEPLGEPPATPADAPGHVYVDVDAATRAEREATIARPRSITLLRISGRRARSRRARRGRGRR